MHTCMHVYVCVTIEFKYIVDVGIAGGVDTPVCVCVCIVGEIPRSPVSEGRAVGKQAKVDVVMIC
jgi:hypothetical protein